MALAQHTLKDPDYLMHFHKMLNKGNTVILDNGAYEEEQLGYKDLIAAIQELHPTYYVLPDDPGDFKSSSMMSLDFLDYIKRNRIRLNSKPLWVVHAEDGDLPNFVNSYELGATNADGVCFSRLTKQYGLKDEVPEMRRVQFIHYLKALKKWRTGRYYHCLGLLAGSLRELPHLAAEEINSVDSSAPVWRGLMGYMIHQPWPDFPFEIRPKQWSSASSEKGERGVLLATSNLKKVQEACQPVLK